MSRALEARPDLPRKLAATQTGFDAIFKVRVTFRRRSSTSQPAILRSRN